MTAVISLLIVSATAAFGAVYPWGYVPLFVAAACSGLVGLARHRDVPPETRGIAIGLVCVALAVGAQLIPLSRSTLDLVSPRAVDLLDCYSLTFATSGRHPLSINPAATTRGLVGLIALGLYLVGVPALFSSRDLRALTRNLMLFAVPLAIAGIFGREHNNGRVYGFWQPQEGGNGNGFGPFVNRNHFAGWMLMTSCLAIGALCGQIEIALEHVKPGLRNRVVWLSSRDANRIILTAVGIAVMAVSLVWTMSRSGIASFTCAVACFAWLMARRRKVGSARRIGVIATLGAVLLVSINWRGVDRLVQWFSDTTDLESRLAAWRDGWQVVREFSLAGTGINTYPDAMLFYQRHVLEFWMTHAHNDYLQFLAEGGLLVSVPAALALVLLVIAIRRSVNGTRNADSDYWMRTGASVGLVAVGIQETVEFSLHIPANALLFATLAAVAISPTHKSSRRLTR